MFSILIVCSAHQRAYAYTFDHSKFDRILKQYVNDILRKKFKDPRIHFAIICASLGCPPLPRLAYTGENVQAKLDEQTRKYINSPQGTRIDRPENTLYLSKLFDWYADDFKAKSGSVMNFIKPYLTPEALEFLKQNPKVKYIHYNWALNAQAPLR